MVSDFDPAPVAPDKFAPLLRTVAVHRQRTHIVTGEEVFGIFKRSRLALDANHGLDVGEVDVEGLDGADGDDVPVDATMRFLRAGKRGDSFSVRRAVRQ